MFESLVNLYLTSLQAEGVTPATLRWHRTIGEIDSLLERSAPSIDACPEIPHPRFITGLEAISAVSANAV